jgi:hypothetical protein
MENGLCHCCELVEALAGLFGRGIDAIAVQPFAALALEAADLLKLRTDKHQLLSTAQNRRNNIGQWRQAINILALLLNTTISNKEYAELLKPYWRRCLTQP